MRVEKTADAMSASAPFKVLEDLANVWRSLVITHIDTYRPEKHYMRGPGPKWREKQARTTAAAQS
jgi:hypothetical protein